MSKSELIALIVRWRQHTRDICSCSTKQMTLEYNHGVDYALTCLLDKVNKLNSLE